MLTWDKTKRITNLAKHGYDLADAESLFDSRIATWEDNREDYGEQRWVAVGVLHGRFMHLTYTDDGETLRAISFREAEKHEIRRYFEKIAG